MRNILFICWVLVDGRYTCRDIVGLTVDRHRAPALPGYLYSWALKTSASGKRYFCISITCSFCFATRTLLVMHVGESRASLILERSYSAYSRWCKNLCWSMYRWRCFCSNECMLEKMFVGVKRKIVLTFWLIICCWPIRCMCHMNENLESYYAVKVS